MWQKSYCSLISIGGVIICVLLSNSVVRGFEPWSTQTSDYKIGICFFSSKQEIRTFARPGVLRAVFSAVIIRSRRWIRRRCLSWRCGVRHGLPLRGLSFVLPVCRRRIISLEMVIIDALKWSAAAWWVIPAWAIPTARSRHFDGAVASNFLWIFKFSEWQIVYFCW